MGRIEGIARGSAGIFPSERISRSDHGGARRTKFIDHVQLRLKLSSAFAAEVHIPAHVVDSFRIIAQASAPSWRMHRPDISHSPMFQATTRAASMRVLVKTPTTDGMTRSCGAASLGGEPVSRPACIDVQ